MHAVSMLRVLLGCCVVSQLLLQNVVNAGIVVVNLGSRHPRTKSLNCSSLTRKTAHDLKMPLQKNMNRALGNLQQQQQWQVATFHDQRHI